MKGRGCPHNTSEVNEYADTGLLPFKGAMIVGETAGGRAHARPMSHQPKQSSSAAAPAVPTEPCEGMGDAAPLTVLGDCFFYTLFCFMGVMI